MECKWTFDKDYNFWDTGCGDTFYFDDDVPKEHDFKYCPFCGGRIVEDKEDE